MVGQLQWRQVETHATAIRAEKTQDTSSVSYLTGEELIRQICVRMRVRSFDDLNVGPPHAFAPIRQVLDLEHDLWEFVGMYVSLRSISTVHDAELEFLAKRGVPSFAALGLGNSFAASPAVAYHFNLPRATTTVLPLTTKAVLSHLGEFRFLNQRYQDTGAFLSFLTSKLAAPRGTVLGVHVQNLQRSMDLMRRIQVEERKQLNDIENDFRRDVAHSVFQLTKEKFSAENREKAVAAAVASSQLDLPRGEQKANVSVKLESDILTRVTVLDAHLDHLIGRYSHRLPKDTSSVISKQDLKLRATVCHKKHERSRSTVVSWVLCSIIAKSRVLLDAKRLAPEGQPQQQHLASKTDDQVECTCCCVGKPACTCNCTCECHAADSDSSDDDDEEEGAKADRTDIPPSSEDPRPDADAVLRDRWVTTHQSRPDLSIFQLLEAVHGATPTNSWAGGDHTSFVSALAALDSTQPLPLPPSAPSAASLPPDHVHALLYQCRLVQNAFESPPDEPSPALVSLVHHALSVEDPTKKIDTLDTLNGCPATAPYFSLYFTSPLTNLAGIDRAPSTLDMAALLSSVERVPCLVDVEAAVLWQDLHHGPFPQFFMSNFPHIPLLQLPTKRYVKLDASMATLSQLQDTTSAPQAHKVATSYVSLYVLSHGRVPWSDLPHAFECVLSTVDLHVRPWFVLQVLQYVPAVFWKVLAPPVLSALGKTVSHVHRALANATTTSVSDRVLLGQLGQVLEISQDLFATLDNTHKDDKEEEAIAKPPCPSVPLSLPAPCLPVHPPGKDVPPLKSHQLSANPPANHISTTHDKMDKCQDVVEHIRKHSFGVGLPGSNDTRAFLRVQQDRLERALQRLSAELYSTSTHFVLELLQNADDNTYASHVAPCAEFVVRDDAISFFCNEIGFQASHVRALCDVGASTKSVGMIGQKGIGFKSVFAVSDCPEIHSNGYHVHLDARARADNVRYIMPYWIPSPDPEFTNQLGTWFHLPKRDSPSSSSSVIAAGAMLDSLEPSTLLFLNQLMSLTITNRVLHTQVVYRKTWTSSDRVDLHTNMGDVQPWHVHGVSVDVPALFASIKGASTRVQMAFPLSFDGSSLPNQPVFAYLPVQSYGFKCILQANFDLPSSREAILDNEWNQFLLRQFPRLFVDQLVQLLPEFPHLIRMIPVDIAPPFHLMGHAVVRLLQDLPLIQAASGAYVAPRHVLDQIEADHPISDALLWQSCQKHFIHPEFAPLLSPQLKRMLGILPWNATHMVQLARTIASSSSSSSSSSRSLTWHAQFMDLVASLNPMAPHLRPLSLFPVKSHRHDHGKSLKSVEDSLFYPLDVVDVPFADELNILHPEYIHALAPKTTRFLHVLGIKQLTTHDMLQFHLLPLVATSKTTEHDHAKALAFCMHVHIERPLPTPLLHLVRQSVRVVTASGDLTPLSTPHLSLEPPEFAFSALTVVAATSVVSSSSAFSFLQAVGLPVFMSLHSPDGVVPGLPFLLTSIVTNQDIAGATALMQYLDRNWTTQHSATYGSVVSTLQTSPWLPTSTTLLNPTTPAIALKYPNESYLDVPAGLKPYFPSSAVLNREFASVLQIHIGLGVPEYLHLLQLDAVSADTVVACLLELKAHATGQPDVLQSIQAALSAAPILPVNNQRVRLHHTIWKPSTSCPDLVALRPAFPKTLKSFFVQLGVPVKPTVAVALAALESSNVADPRPYLQFVAEQPLDSFPAQLEPIAFLTTTHGAKVSFESQPLLVEEEPSWWSHMSPNPSDKLVVISHPENAPFAGFWQFGTSLVQDVQDNPDKWNDLLHEAMMEESPHGSLVSGPIIQAFLCFLLDTWTTPNIVRISHLPTQGGVFEPFESVYATSSSQLRHPRALELPRRYHDILAKMWGLAMLPVTTSVIFDSAVPDASLHQRLSDALQAVPPHFNQMDKLQEQPPIQAFLDSVQCWSAENLRVSFTVQSPPCSPSSDDWTSSGVIIEAKPAVLDAFKLYINTPVEFPDVLSTLVSLLWSPLIAPQVARSLQPCPRRHQNPDPIPLKRQLFPLDLPPAKRPRQDFALRPPPSDSGDRMFQFRPNLLTDEAKFAIGRVGEAHVYDLLRTEYPPESVEWINEVEETGRPYDICIHHQSGGTEFIEVKSTSTYDKRVFEMSVQELECATQKGSQYSIYRAFAIRPQGALPDSRVIRLRNPITLLRHKKLALSVLMTDEVM